LLQFSPALARYALSAGGAHGGLGRVRGVR
jgi:hypothetical protein